MSLWLVAVTVVASGEPRAAAGPQTGQAAPDAPGGPARSVLDGVFTDDQAKRGQSVVVSICSACHGKALEGGAEAPALVGAGFIANWTGQTVGDLVERTQRSMPDDNPGSLTRQQYTDAITFVLASNHYPSGKSDLPIDPETQKRIKIVPIK